ncbi:MAG: SPOR domain-containing protein [Acidobacteriota bacterium]
MSQSPEPSYYEIALTNRQVVVAFVILLACLVSAFLSGIWLGRGGEVRAAAGAADDTVTMATLDVESDGPAADAPDRLSFFDRDETENVAAGATPPDRNTTLQEDLNAPAPRRPAPAPRQAEPEPQQAPPPRQTPPPAAQQPAPRPATSQPAAAPPRQAPAPAGNLHIQVFSSADQAQAQKVVDRLVRGGRGAFLSPVEVDGQVMYRVRIGPYADRATATQVADQVRRDYRLDTWITQ